MKAADWRWLAAWAWVVVSLILYLRQFAELAPLLRAKLGL